MMNAAIRKNKTYPVGDRKLMKAWSHAEAPCFSSAIAETTIDKQVVLFDSNLGELLGLITAPKDIERAVIVLATDRVYRWALEHPLASQFHFGDINDRNWGDWRCACINDPGFYFGDGDASTYDPDRLDKDPFIMIISAVECIVKEYKKRMNDGRSPESTKFEWLPSFHALEYIISRTQDLIDWIILEDQK